MQTVPVEQLVGKALGNYHIQQMLGHGTLSAVYIAQSFEQQEPVMLTVFLLPEGCTGRARARFMTRFNREASVLVQLKHPHILPVYDFGDELGYPYLITPLEEGSSLTRFLKQRGRCTPAQTLGVLKQIASGLSYAHDNGVVHGTLKPAYILLDSRQSVHIAGLSLYRMLEMRGIGEVKDHDTHLFSVAGTFLGIPEYIAPEVVQGSPLDARSDVYSLAMIVFELLSGQPPFTGPDPFEVAMMHVQRDIPSLQSLWPDIPAALDLVLQRALERDPAQRISSVDKLALAFERALSIVEGALGVSNGKQASSANMTLPPTVNRFEESQGKSTSGTAGQLPLNPTLGTNPRLPAMPLAGEGGNWQLRPPIVTSEMAAVKVDAATAVASQQQSAKHANATGPDEVDPFAWWSSSSLTPAGGSMPGTFTQHTLPRVEAAKPAPQKQRKQAKKVRRRTVLLAASGVAAGLVATAGFSLANGILNLGLTQTTSMQQTYNQGQGNMGGNTQPTPNNNTPQPTAKATPTTKPTQPPAKPTQPPPMHTGTVIGATNQAANSSKAFTNPADNNASLLIRLPNGNFVAYESACTHERVPVYYDAATHQLICPRHGAQFDPANNGAVLQGPARFALPRVQVRVNNDGTITTG